MLTTGDRAPGFELPGTDGKTIRQYELTDYTDSGAVVLLFYPFAFSPVCTEQLCGFREAEWLTVADDYGVRADEVEHHPSVTQRAVFAVDENRTIRYTWATEDIYESPEIDEVRRAIHWLPGIQ